MGEKKSFVYIKSKEYAWVPAIQTHTDGKKATVSVPQYKDEQSMDSDGGRGAKKSVEEIVDLKNYTSGVLPLQNVDNTGLLLEFADMVELPYLHEAGILYNLKRRHRDGKPYTRTGDIIIAINPFQWFLDLYTDEMRVKYSNKLVWQDHGENDPRSQIDPHVYETSALSYKGLAFTSTDQSILVSGESGAGKTETVKIAMNHMASVQRGPVTPGGDDNFEDPVVNRVLQSNPLLETFGNAKTTRNDNSSRFGKYVQLQFDNTEVVPGIIDRSKSRCHLAGSKCEAYLLEKNRVTGHTDPERTYHIFYQIIAAPEDQKKSFWSGLAGTTFDSFKYVGKTETLQIEKRTDAQWFEDTCSTLELINLGGDKLTTLMRAITAVMQCGNLTFGALGGDADKSECTSSKDLAGLADLIGVPEADLNLGFTERTMKTRNETYKVPLNPEAAKNGCDAFAKEVYGKLFLWLVEGINVATKAENNYHKADQVSEYGIIGLLDIFGFESFVINRFEQLCINYANEKLQQKFTEDIFRSVQAEYEAEGIELAEITFDDNTDVLDLIEGRTGLCAMLNEECVRPKGSDEAFVQKALSANKKSPCMIVNNMDRMGFGIHHFAGKVMYNAEFFVERNQDTLPTDLEELMFKSNNFIVAHKPVEEAPTNGKGPKRQKSNIVGSTIWTKYKSQLTSLMTNLRKTNSRYIRCLKPNKAKVPIKMEHMGTVEQLRCAGVVAAVTITRSAFPNRLPNDTVRLRFSGFWDKMAYPSGANDSMSPAEKTKAECHAMMLCALKEKQEGDKLAFVVGKTRTYFRAGALEFLEANRSAGLEVHAIPIQAIARGYIVRRRFSTMLTGKAEKEREEREKREREAREAAEKAAKAKAEAEAKLKAELDKVAAGNKEFSDRQAKSDAETAKRLAEIEEALKKAETDIEDLKDKTGDAAREMILEPKKQKAAADTKLAANLKLIETLRKENKKIKKENQKVQKKYDEIKKNNKKLLKSNETSGGNFEGENDVMMSVHEKNEKLLDDLEKAKDNNRELKESCQEKQAEYMSTAESRLEFQKTMARILNLIQDNCKDRQLIEDTSSVAHSCEAESKAIMAALEAEYGD